MITTDEGRRARAAAELRRGAPIVVVDGSVDGSIDGSFASDQPRAAALVLSAEMARDDVLADIRAALGDAEWRVAISEARARTLRARVYDDDIARILCDPSVTAARLKAIADPALDLAAPLGGPYQSDRGGDPTAHRAAIGLCKRAQLLPAALVARFAEPADAAAFACAHDLVMVGAADASVVSAAWDEASFARVPIAGAPGALLRVFRRVGWEDEHYALEIGEPPRDAPVLTRLHSACATGDLFGSLKCDCGPQLQGALSQIVAEGAGVLVYLLQEGRGIGLANKMRAYRLQDEGFDTVEANHRLGFADDERPLGDGASILRAMGFRRARVMTNNPKKLEALTNAGIEVVERLPLILGETDENRAYLQVKAAKSGHLL